MTSLVPGAYYFAKSDKLSAGETIIVQVSTVFGDDPAYWTMATVGSEQHHMIADLQILSRIEIPVEREFKQAAE